VLTALLVSACSLGGKGKEPTGPTGLVLTFDHPRRATVGVGERWVVVGKEMEETYLLHAWDVERRRTRQICGKVPPEEFTEGWEKLEAAGLLVPGEDLRLSPSPGSEAFAGRLRLRFREHGKRISARRPLTETEARELVRVLRRWKVALHPAKWRSLPPDLRVEVAIGGCDPPPPKGRKSTGRKP
jgi:hypothetical protein